MCWNGTFSDLSFLIIGLSKVINVQLWGECAEW